MKRKTLAPEVRQNVEPGAKGRRIKGTRRIARLILHRHSSGTIAELTPAKGESPRDEGSAEQLSYLPNIQATTAGPASVHITVRRTVRHRAMAEENS